MNERERLLCVLRGAKPDQTPWFADLDYLLFSLQKRNMLEEKYRGAEGYIAFHRDMGVGACFYYDAALWQITYSGDVRYQEQEAGNCKVCTYTTPKGAIRSIQKYLPESFSWAYTEHFVKTFQDLEIMLYIHEHTSYHKDESYFEYIDALWGGDGLLTATPPISAAPLQKLLARWAGVETTVGLMMDDEQGFAEIAARMEESENAAFEILCASKAQYIEFAENLSSEITGKGFFERYNAPYYKRRTDELHAANKICGIHIDGTLQPCLSMLKACGFDVAEAVTPAPAGTVEPEDLRGVAGEGIILWGGLPSVVFTEMLTQAQFEAYVERILRLFPPGSGFVLGVGDQVPPDCVMQRLPRVREIIQRMGG